MSKTPSRIRNRPPETMPAPLQDQQPQSTDAPDFNNDITDPNEAVMEAAALPVDPPVPPVAAMTWNGPVGTAGIRTPVPPDSDPETIAIQLVQAGNEEAGSEQRQAATNSFPRA